jgi:hypothetical protein
MESFGIAIPLLLSFSIGLLFGVLAAGFLPPYLQTYKRGTAQSGSDDDNLVWFLLPAAFAFGVLATLALGAII